MPSNPQPLITPADTAFTLADNTTEVKGGTDTLKSWKTAEEPPQKMPALMVFSSKTCVNGASDGMTWAVRVPAHPGDMSAVQPVSPCEKSPFSRELFCPAAGTAISQQRNANTCHREYFIANSPGICYQHEKRVASAREQAEPTPRFQSTRRQVSNRATANVSSPPPSGSPPARSQANP